MTGDACVPVASAAVVASGAVVFIEGAAVGAPAAAGRTCAGGRGGVGTCRCGHPSALASVRVGDGEIAGGYRLAGGGGYWMCRRAVMATVV
ncbi:hypothetical protein GCM10009827_110690 [Dactylosporangium maewongense]|uniref:Uncharacterized protein n=1 Tax=Dactylosporangium maewongense TaxID=634393 RepID=A0ABN2D5H5_9ACTN